MLWAGRGPGVGGGRRHPTCEVGADFLGEAAGDQGLTHRGLPGAGLSGRECSSRKSCTSEGRGVRRMAVWGQATERVLGLLVSAGSQHRPEEVRGLVSSVKRDLESLQVIP